MSSNKTVIAVDAMGGDLGPSVVVPGAIEAARQTGAKILLVGNEATLDGELNRLSPSGVDLEIVHAPEVAGMDEKPSDILRRKKNASIQVACRLVRDGAAQGVVSAGHSGASVACGMFIMGRIPALNAPPSRRSFLRKRNPSSCWTWVPPSIASPTTSFSSA